MPVHRRDGVRWSNLGGVSLFSAYALAVNLPYALAFWAVAAEVTWLARAPGPGRRRILSSMATAAPMAAGALVIGVAYTVVLEALWRHLEGARFEPLAELWHRYPLVGAAAAFVAWDCSGWLYHLIGHRTRVGWAAHQPHHSGSGYDMTLGLRQSWAPFHGLLHHPLLALLGFDLRVVVVCAAVSNLWQVLEHTSLPIRFPRWFEAVVMTPGAHRHHHGRDGGLVNVGPFFTCWDRMAGTWVPPSAPAPLAYGPAVAASRNPIAIELAGWAALARSARGLRPAQLSPAPSDGSAAGGVDRRVERAMANGMVCAAGSARPMRLMGSSDETATTSSTSRRRPRAPMARATTEPLPASHER